MKVMEVESTIWIDVDDTLVMWGKIPKGSKVVHVTCPYTGEQFILRKHLGHIKILKDRHVRGSLIVVWSAAGYKWAAAVIKALGLSAYVDLVVSKPHAYIDDKKAKDFMGERIYLSVDGPYGK